MSDLDPIVAAAVSGGSIGALTLAYAKWSAARLIAQYDAAHKRHDERILDVLERVARLSSDVAAKLAALEVRLAEVIALRDRFADTDRTVAVLADRSEKLREDLNVAHKRIRSLGGG